MKYFENFPSIYYTFDPDLIDFKQVTNIFARVRMLDSIINNVAVYYTYPMKDSDTVEGIAYKYYGDANRYWIIMFSNKILDPYFQLPLSLDEFNRKLILNYGSVTNAMATLHHIEKRTTVQTSHNGSINEQLYTVLVDPSVVNLDGVDSGAFPTPSNPVVQIGANTSVTFPDGTVSNTSTLLVAVSNYDYEDGLNEQHREIKLIKKDYVSQIETELKKLLTQ